ncbi:LOW QUALITY PROTEIN: cell surface glycoprotein 1 [Drosophila obscura]|uniref:LOW QUALITY PROTEIN: cell surface glycoprotein 1 n=1 Tax=Drosophila obscura TaxID=7282 RepID=UPI001BB119C2|nr:LOW QUALITY PROTEIN: cell surface glycoprotein 1 [Drosophila obscura]
MSDETGAQKPETVLDNSSVEEAALDEKKTPKRTPKRRSFIERAQRESEELVRTMGGSLELEGGRRTRSSTRGTPTRATEAVTPPPSKKARTSPTTATKSGGAGKGRSARKLDVGSDELDQEPEKANAEVVESAVKAKATPKKDKKEVKKDEKPVKATPKKAVPATKTEPEKEEKPADAKETDAKTIESEDQPDGGAAKLPAVPEKQQNHAAEEDKPSKDEPEVKEKTPEEVPKAEDPPKSNDDPENGTSTDTPAPAAAADPAPAAMEVDEEKPEAAAASDNQTEAKSAPATTSEPEPKKQSEPAREPSPEPMEVDSSSKSSTETVRFTPAAEKVASSAEATKSSNNVVDEIATEVKEDVPAEPKEGKKAESSDEPKSTEEPKPAESAEEPKEAVRTTGEKVTPTAEVPAPATNDVSKPTPVVAVDAVVSETPIKEVQPISAVNKSELNVNGEPKIVNNSVDGGEHATPKVWN